MLLPDVNVWLALHRLTFSVWCLFLLCVGLSSHQLAFAKARKEASSIRAIALSPDGKHVLLSDSQEGGRLVSLESGKTERILRCGRSVFTNDPNHIVCPGWRSPLALWDIAKDTIVREFKAREVRGVRALAVSDNGKLAVLANDDRTLQLWDLTSGKEIWTVEAHTKPLTSVIFSRDGTQIFSGSLDGTLRLWSVSTGKQIRTFQAKHEVLSIALSPSGRFVLSGGERGAVELWEVASAQRAITFGGHTAAVNSVAFSADGKQALSGGDDGYLRLWDVISGKEMRSWKWREGPIRSIVFTPDSKRAIVLSGQVSVTVWDVAQGEVVLTLSGPSPKGPTVVSVAILPDGKHGLSASGHSITLWDFASGNAIRTMKEDRNGRSFDFESKLDQRRAINSMALSQDYRFAITVDGEGCLRMWDVANAKLLWKREEPKLALLCVAFSPDRKRFVCGSYNGLLQVRDAATGNVIRAFHDDGKGIEALAFSPDGKLCLLQGRTLRLWNVDTGKLIRTLDDDKRGHCVAFSPDGRTCVSGGLGLRHWEMGSGKLVRTFAETDEAVHLAVAFSRDGKLALSTEFRGTVKLWDVRIAKVLREFVPRGVRMTQWAVAFSHDGKLALSGGEGDTLILWDVATGREMRSLSVGRAY